LKRRTIAIRCSVSLWGMIAIVKYHIDYVNIAAPP